MKLSPEEESFLRHWMYDEVHFQNGPGLAKQLRWKNEFHRRIWLPSSPPPFPILPIR